MVSPRTIKSPRIVHRNNTARLTAFFFLGVLLGVSGWMGFDYGREWAGFAAGKSGRTVKRLRAAVTAMESEREQLRQRVASLERSSQIDQEATRLAKEDLKRLQAEQQSLQRDLEFYRNLLQEGSEGAFRIKNLKLRPTQMPGVFQYWFSIRQVKEAVALSEGEILVSAEGTRDGRDETLGPESVKMRFRHYQNVRGEFLLPDGFEAQRVVLEVKPVSKKIAPLKQQFEWRPEG